MKGDRMKPCACERRASAGHRDRKALAVIVFCFHRPATPPRPRPRLLFPLLLSSSIGFPPLAEPRNSPSNLRLRDPEGSWLWTSSNGVADESLFNSDCPPPCWDSANIVGVDGEGGFGSDTRRTSPLRPFVTPNHSWACCETGSSGGNSRRTILTDVRR